MSLRRGDGIEVVADEQGSRTTPSYVGFTETDVVVGEAALSQAHTNQMNTIFDIKQMIGQKCSDPTFQAKMKRWPFKVVPGANDQPVVQVTLKGKPRQFEVSDLVGFVLDKMRETANSFMGSEVSGAVIAVPGSYSEAEREIMLEAATKAKITQAYLINECSATAIANDLDMFEESSANSNTTALILDLGAASFEVTLMNASNGILSVVEASSSRELGGNNVDDLVLALLCSQFEKKNNVCISDGSANRSMRKLRTAAEKAKRGLATRPQASIELDGFHEGLDFFTTLTKARFEAMIGRLMSRCAEQIEQVLTKAGVGKDQVDKVICVGGSSKLAKFRQLIDKLFGASKVVEGVPAEDAVAIGAAEEATLRAKQTGSEERSIPVCAATIGMEVSGGLVLPMIPRGALLPFSCSKSFTSNSKGSNTQALNIYQGERLRACDNRQVASVVLPAKDGAQLVCVTMETSGAVTLQITRNDSDKQEVVIDKMEVLSAEALNKEFADAPDEDKVIMQWVVQQADLKQACEELQVAQQAEKQRQEVLAWLSTVPFAPDAETAKALCDKAITHINTLKEAAAGDDGDDEGDSEEGDDSDDSDDNVMIDDDLDD